MQQDEQFLADRERQLQQQRQQQERRSPLSQERDGPHPMWMKIPYPNDPVEAYIPAEVQPLSSPSSSSVGMPSLTFSSVEQSMRLSASLSSTQQLSGSPCRAHLPSPGSPPQVGVGVDGLNGTAHGPTGGAGMRARGGNNAEGANGVHGMNEMIDHEYFLTSALSMIPPEMLAHPGPPIPHFDYLTEFPQRQMMASGGNGQIRRAHWPAKGCYVILKCLMDTKHTPFQLELMFDKEVEVMKICGNHDNLVQFFGIATRNDPGNMERHMIMKFYEKGDLVNLLEKPLGHPDLPTIKERLYLALDITQGLEHLYNCGFHHGDLHPKNILIDDRQNDKHLRYQARLTDFGLRRIRNNTNLVSSQPLAGVWRFMAPERLQRNRARYDVRCDIFALGVIFWYLMSGRYPFKNNTEVPHNAREERIEGTPDWYYAMYTQAWSESPHHRQQDLRSIIQTIQTHLEKEPHELSGMDHPSWSHPSYPTPSLGYDSRMAPSPGRTLGSGGNYVGGHQYNAQQAYPTASASSGGSGVSPSANPETATITASSHAPKSSNPKHPRYKKPDIPNGMARRIGPR
ncbi:hypothetical protein BX616_005844 [Lobosporangium transversale]|nr:hypothetical protein BX616_005844 [Lobosporangium transversale]